MSPIQKIVLLSIKPEFADKILFGIKHYEYRKQPISPETSHILLYMTSPVMKIVGIVEVKEIHEAAPSVLWEQTKSASGITRKFYREYFYGKKKAFAIELGQVIPLNFWIDPKEIVRGFRAPQSFQYVDSKFYYALFDKNTKRDELSHILFFGGIHGVGKSTFCNRLKCEINIDTVSASEIIREEKEGLTNKDKRVKDIMGNQELLLTGLKKKSRGGDFLLDGHFCLLNSEGEIEKIPLEVFRKINPRKLFLLEENPLTICKNLEKRDGIKYDIGIIKKLLHEEASHARYIAKKLGRTLSVITRNDYTRTRYDLEISMRFYENYF